VRAKIGLFVVVTLVAGCSGSAVESKATPPHRTVPAAGQIVWRDTRIAVMQPTSLPVATIPFGVVDLYAAGDLVLAATYHGISRSTDGGRHWQTALGHDQMSSVTRGPTGYAALGIRRSDDRPVTATSRDGVHWTTVVAARNDGPAGVGDALVLDGESGIAVSLPNRFPSAWPMMRTTDGGRHWRRVRRFRYAGGGLQMSASGTIVATAPGTGKNCAGAVYSSVDLGATWSELPGSCSPLPLTDVQFVDATHAVAVGGVGAEAGGGRIIETTADGGTTWQLTNHTRTRAVSPSPDGFGGVDFLTPTTGFVFGGLCPDSLQGPCGGDLYWTTDAGRHLTRLPDPAPEGWLSIAKTGPGRFVARPPAATARMRSARRPTAASIGGCRCRPARSTSTASPETSDRCSGATASARSSATRWVDDGGRARRYPDAATVLSRVGDGGTPPWAPGLGSCTATAAAQR
jgi:hypothetical protein